MSIYEISTCLEGGKSYCGGEEDASNLLWCEHCAIALCFDCDSELHNAKNSKHGHLRVLLPSSRTSSVRKCEHGVDGGGHVRLDLIRKVPAGKEKRKASRKKERGSLTVSASSSESERRSIVSGSDLVNGGATVTFCDVEDGCVHQLETQDIPAVAPVQLFEKAPSSPLKSPRSALRGGSEVAGLGPRPKQHVRWHPDVVDPVCSIVSHTVGNKHAPAFLSRRSYQKHLRQKSKASSKAQARLKKQENNKLKKRSEPVKTRPDNSSESVVDMKAETEGSITSGMPAVEGSAGPMGNNCIDCTVEGTPGTSEECDFVHIPDSSIVDRCLQQMLFEGDVHSGKSAIRSVQDTNIVKGEDKKCSVQEKVKPMGDEYIKEGFSEAYHQLLASMLNAATSLRQNESLNAPVEYEAVARLFRDAERHSPVVNLSGSNEVFKQATESKLSPWISVV